MEDQKRFNTAKAFSDFLGFHVRAVFCLTLCVASFYPIVNDLFIELLTYGNSPVDRTRSSFLISVLSMLTFFVFFVVIVYHIGRTILEYLGRKTSNYLTRALILIPLSIAECSALLAIPLFVFVQLPILSDSLGGGALPQDVRRCLLDELVHQNGIALGQPARPECPQLLTEFRTQLGITGETTK